MFCSAAPTNVVLYTLAESGYIGFYDPTATANGDLYFVERSLRPVAVAYDPVRQVISRLLSLSITANGSNFRVLDKMQCLWIDIKFNALEESATNVLNVHRVRNYAARLLERCQRAHNSPRSTGRLQFRATARQQSRHRHCGWYELMITTTTTTICRVDRKTGPFLTVHNSCV